jgi:hypothetical protein
MTLRRHVISLLAAASALLLATTVGTTPAHATPASATTSGVPSVPTHLTTQVGVDGVTLSWWRGTVTATTPGPTSYVIRRHAEGNDLTWVVPTSPSSDSWNTPDLTLPVGLPATYTVAARGSAGDSAESAPADATVPAWPGPYDPARQVLTMVWDQAAAGPSTDLETTLASRTSTPPLAQAWANGLMGFSAGAGSLFALPLDTPDGDYVVGPGDGSLHVAATSGARCSAPNGAPPTGSATVRRTAPSRFHDYAAITVDADLLCGNGHRLRVELRWQTPDDVHTLATAPSTVIEAQPDGTTTHDVAVTNTGSLDVTLGAASLVAADLSTTAPLTVAGSTCEGRTLPPGESCAVTVRYVAGAAGSAEGNGILVLASDLGEVELGRVVGQQPVAYAGAQAITVTGAPAGVDLDWREPSTLDSRLIRGWRVEEVAGTTTTVRARAADYGRAVRVTGLGVGAHALRVVMSTADGRDVASAPIAVTVPRRWLLVATRNGVLALDPDGGHTDGGSFGARTSAVGVAFAPSRDRVVLARGPGDGWLETATVTGAGVHRLSYQPLFGDDDPAVSPDGTRFVLHRLGYSGPETRESSLIVAPLTGGTLFTVPASAGLSGPSWTPDGTAVVAAQDSGAALVTVTVATGKRVPLAGTTGGRAPAVSRTGRLAYIWRDAVSGSDEIRLTSLTGGAQRRLAVHDGLWDLDWDPTGRWLAATGGPYGEAQHTYVYDLAATPTLVRTLPSGGSAVTWLDTASSAPAASLVAPAWTGTTAALTVNASDPDDAVGGLRRECRLDDATTWVACGPTWSPSGLTPGRHTAYARVTDPSGHQSAVAARSFAVDPTRPTATLAALPSVLTSATATLGWTAADSGGSGLSAYDVRWRYAAPSGRLGSHVYPAAWQGLRTRTVPLRMLPGYQYCVSARARDAAGNVGAWSAESCAAVALDDRALTASSGWTRGTSSTYAYGTWSRALRSAASLTRPAVQGRRVVLVATTCPTCGSVDVYHAGVKLGRVSLTSARTASRQLRWLPLQQVSRTGTLVVRTTSSSKVLVDGVAVLH